MHIEELSQGFGFHVPMVAEYVSDEAILGLQDDMDCSMKSTFQRFEDCCSNRSNFNWLVVLQPI